MKVLLVLALLGVGLAANIPINDAQLPFLNVHIIAHTHDDVGWLKTVDEYYMGANQSIQDAGVQYILDNTIASLIADPTKKFIYVEIAFFERWWNEQNEYMKGQVRQLVSTGQLEFINGGWCMNDEAGTYYPAIIEQMTEGHQFLFREFGVRPRIGWHIDPFGHAATMASLMSQMGFDAFFFGRIEYTEHTIRLDDAELEFVWRPSQSLGKDTQIWTHVLYSDYCYLPGFAFEWGDPPIQDDPRIFDVNVQQRCDEFAALVRQRSAAFRTNNVLTPFGCDFRYENAIMNFKNIDKLIKYINNNPQRYNMNLKYSTPSIYMEAVHNENVTWEVRTGDFFPYADCPDCYWTGYFTSRPALKGYVRTMDNFLHATDKLFASAALPSLNVTQYYEEIDVLTRAFSVAQHHDAVAGTEKQHVADDYAERLYIGQESASEVMSDVIGSFISGGSANPPSFTFCPLMNVSICPATAALAQGQAVPVVVINPIAWDRNHFVQVVVPISNVDVYDTEGKLVVAQIFENADYPDQFTMIFPVYISPMGFSTYTLQPGTGEKTRMSYKRSVQPGEKVEIENSYYKLKFDSMTNLLHAVENKVTGISAQVEQNFLWWWGMPSSGGQPSGAYIFRPNGTEAHPVIQSNPQITVNTGEYVTQITQVFNEWVSQTTTLFVDEPLWHSEVSIGPIDVSDYVGKEVITRYSTSLNTNQLFYTDSEGDEMQQRRLNWRPWNQTTTSEPVSSNYYPVNTVSYIRDETAGQQFSIFTDRSRGGSSLANGQLENMIHRRLLYDDYRGVGEPLDEDNVVRTEEWLTYDNFQNSSALLRQLALLLNHQPILAFGNAASAQDWISQYKTTFAPVAQQLPGNVHMTNLKTMSDGRVILRLHHIYAVGENDQLSLPVKVDLDAIFANLTIVDIEEMTLTANRPISELHRLEWITSDMKDLPQTVFSPVDPNDRIVVLNPMDTRTFIVRFMD